jgi:hypothetical protein
VGAQTRSRGPGPRPSTGRTRWRLVPRRRPVRWHRSRSGRLPSRRIHPRKISPHRPPVYRPGPIKGHPLRLHPCRQRPRRPPTPRPSRPNAHSRPLTNQCGPRWLGRPKPHLRNLPPRRRCQPPRHHRRRPPHPTRLQPRPLDRRPTRLRPPSRRPQHRHHQPRPPHPTRLRPPNRRPQHRHRPPRPPKPHRHAESQRTIAPSTPTAGLATPTARSLHTRDPVRRTDHRCPGHPRAARHPAWTRSVRRPFPDHRHDAIVNERPLTLSHERDLADPPSRPSAHTPPHR